MASLQPVFLAQLTFGASDLSTIHRLGEARGRQDLFVRKIPQQLETLRTRAMVESVESSNRIEGVVASPGRGADLVVQGAEPRDRSEQEMLEVLSDEQVRPLRMTARSPSDRLPHRERTQAVRVWANRQGTVTDGCLHRPGFAAAGDFGEAHESARAEGVWRSER